MTQPSEGVNVDYIVGLGSEDDVLSLALETKARRHVANLLRPELPKAVREERVRIHLEMVPEARLRSYDTTYNCFGMVFATRRTCIIDEGEVRKILHDDGYQDLPLEPGEWSVGDLVLYQTADGEIQHVGMIAQIVHDLEGGGTSVEVLSAWGQSGEFLHPLDAVPELYGEPARVVTHRRVA